MAASKMQRKNVFYIPAGVPFLDALAGAVLADRLGTNNDNQPSGIALPHWTILLPTRRATRALMQAFLAAGDGSAQLLPRIQPLGDVDEDELALSDLPAGLGTETVPDAISGLERQFILYDLIHQWVGENSDTGLAIMLADSTVHAFDLARSLGAMVDSFETSDIDLKIIENLFEGEFAEHRLQILAFLAIVQKQLPMKITELGKIGASARRNKLMQAYTDFLTGENATGPVIAAGSTGSIPATAQLLSCIAAMENGAVVLPGLDVGLDEESWDSLRENHPQFGMRELLGKMGVERADISLLPGVEETASGRAKNWLASELMRPAETTDQWRKAVTKSRQTLIKATDNTTVLGAQDQREEALAIALIMRKGIEDERSVCLVTPDRQLARNVKAELARWKIEINDSAGEPLMQSPPATFVRLLLEAAKSRFSPLTLKALLFHPLARFSTIKEEQVDLFAKFEIALLRSETGYDGLQGLLALCRKHIDFPQKDPYAHPAFKNLDEQDWQAIADLSNQLVETLQPLADIFSDNLSRDLSELANCHLRVAEAACHRDDIPCDLWQGEAGEKLTDLFSHMQAAARLAPQMTSNDYAILLDQQLALAVLRPKFVRHGTLAIYGLLEARLISTDVIIMGGLNETIWPPVAEVDPWLTRPQLRSAGLPTPERRTGLTAHDFAQGFCANKVYLTYAKKLGNSPAVPSRWILRLDALLMAAKAPLACRGSKKEPWLEWVRQLDLPEAFKPASRPCPKPPVEIRPVNFSVSGVDTLLKDPYAFFANKILKLKPLPPLDQQAGAAERGSLVHVGLQNFIQDHPDQLPDNAVEILQDEFRKLAVDKIPDTTLRVFWQPQFARMADWFVEQEIELRENCQTSFVEISGQHSFQVEGTEYRLSARADRLDVLDDRMARIIDYKTGDPPSFTETAENFSPQLLLEAVIASHGGFENVASLTTSSLIYMKLSGGVPAGEITSSGKKLNEQIDNAAAGLKTLLATYGQVSHPYLANAEPVRIDMEREFDYLSRWREWAHLADREDAE